MEEVDEIKEGGTETMPTATPDPPKTGGVEAMRTGKGNLPRNAGIVARKATRRVNFGRSATIRRKPDPDPVSDKPTRKIGSVHTTPKDLEKPEKGQP